MLEHGGNVHAASRQYGIALADWLDLSTGINSDGYPVPEIPAAAWQRLPESSQQLEQSAADYYGARQVLATAGSQAAIQTLPRLRKPCRVTVLGPMYAEHAYAWQRQGHIVSEIDHLPDAALLENTDVLLVCNPNNPTGRLIAPAMLREWQRVLAAKQGWLVVDEAFMDSTPEYSLAAFSHLEGLIVLRSLGKFFGLAGARVGFLLAEPAVLEQVAELAGPWPVAGPARYVAHAALSDRDWQHANRARLAESCQRLSELLSQYGLVPVHGCALFQWLQAPYCAELHRQLAQRSIWTRHFPQQHGLRLGLPPESGWEKLEAALRSLAL